MWDLTLPFGWVAKVKRPIGVLPFQSALSRGVQAACVSHHWHVTLRVEVRSGGCVFKHALGPFGPGAF